MLWSTYWTTSGTRIRSTSSCSNSIQAMVPVASWRRTWSILYAIGSPGPSFPRTRCSSRILLVAELVAVGPAEGPERALGMAGRSQDDHVFQGNAFAFQVLQHEREQT